MFNNRIMRFYLNFFFYFTSLQDLQILSSSEGASQHFLHNNLISKLAASLVEEKLENLKKGLTFILKI